MNQLYRVAVRRHGWVWTATSCTAAEATATCAARTGEHAAYSRRPSAIRHDARYVYGRTDAIILCDAYGTKWWWPIEKKKKKSITWRLHFWTFGAFLLPIFSSVERESSKDRQKKPNIEAGLECVRIWAAKAQNIWQTFSGAIKTRLSIIIVCAWDIATWVTPMCTFGQQWAIRVGKCWKPTAFWLGKVYGAFKILFYIL